MTRNPGKHRDMTEEVVEADLDRPETLNGGRLWAAGNSPRGASFQFTLPATVAAHV